MPVSIKDVAARADVARATVSNVLNNKSLTARISQKTQERVRQAAEELGYRPNKFAQGLGKRRTNIIGLMIQGLGNPFFLNLLIQAEDIALELGYDVLTDTVFQRRSGHEIESKLSGWPVDALIMWVMPHKSITDFFGAWAPKIPVVYLGYERDDNSDWVAIDRKVGVRALMKHLVSQGYRRFAYLYPFVDAISFDMRYQTYAEECKKYSLQSEDIVMDFGASQFKVRPEYSVRELVMRDAGRCVGLELAARKASERPDVVVCHNDITAMGLFAGLRRGGVNVPEDIAVAGFDGIHDGLLLEKTLTSVISPTHALIDHSIQIVHDRLLADPDAKASPRRILLPTELRIGETT